MKEYGKKENINFLCIDEGIDYAFTFGRCVRQCIKCKDLEMLKSQNSTTKKLK
jgi:hypothetical protein